MAQLRTKERPIIEFELTSSTSDDPKWVKAYGRFEMDDIRAMHEAAESVEKESQIVYHVAARLMIDWSWYLAKEKAPITPETLSQLDPVDFIEVADNLGVNDVMTRLMNLGLSKSKKKNSSATSQTKRTPKKASK